MDDFTAAILRRKEWQVAKGHLEAIRELYVSDKGDYKGFSKALKEFIDKVENEGLID